ncbi:MAG: four helix bundle protein [Cytophagales bacterium]|nr:MAG: four helix bundle protein [Cytophagales bacterium]
MDLQRVHKLLQNKAYDLSLEVVSLCKDIHLNYKEDFLTVRLLERATTVGELIIEAVTHTEPQKRRAILVEALSTLNKAHYWFNLTHDSGYVGADKYRAFHFIHSDLSTILQQLLGAKA